MKKMVLKVPVTVTIQMGATINIGNYESRRVSVGLSVPVYETKKLQKVMQSVKTLVKNELEAQVKEIAKERKDENIEIIEEILED